MKLFKNIYVSGFSWLSDLYWNIDSGDQALNFLKTLYKIGKSEITRWNIEQPDVWCFAPNKKLASLL